MICFPLPVKKPLFHKVKQDKPHLFYIVESNGGQALLKSHLSDVIHGISDRILLLLGTLRIASGKALGR